MTRECMVRRWRLEAAVGGKENEGFCVGEVVEATRGRVMAERRGEAEKRWKARENSLGFVVRIGKYMAIM